MIGRTLKSWRRPCWPAYKYRLQHSDLPVLVGPWRSELGFEALYWIPFVQALGLKPERIIPITRGGAASWYGIGAFRGTPPDHRVREPLDLYDLREPKAVRVENILQHRQTGLLKQTRLTPWDRAVLEDAAAKLGLTKYLVLHPAWMYQALAPFWEGQRGLDWAWTHLLTRTVLSDGKTQLSLSPIPPPPVPEGVTLPTEPFVAARFYIRPTFPYAEVCVTVAREIVKQLAQQSPVVLLNSGVHADEHIDIDIRGIPNVFTLADLCTVTPQNNLYLQSVVLGKAQGFAGTYGGLSQLALRMAKPTVSLYLDWHSTALAHKHLADAMATAMKVPNWVVRIQDVPLLKAVLPNVTVG